MAENPIIPSNEPNSGEKLFTQAELDAILGKRLAEERAKYPSKEELDGYKAYKASQPTDNEKLNTLTKERDTAKTELATANAEVERLKHERFLLSKGVPADDLEYYDFKISKAVTPEKNYETAAEEFLKDKQQTSVRVDMGGGFGGGNVKTTPSSMMNDLIRKGAKH